MDGLVVAARGLVSDLAAGPPRVPSKVHQGLKPHRPEFCTHQVYGTKLAGRAPRQDRFKA